jgi:predicted MPP superfamily phosphohydrolase
VAPWRPRSPEGPRTLLTRRKFLKSASLTAAGTFGFAGYGFSNALDLPGVRQRRFDLPNLPLEWEGLRILQISDVHAGPYMDAERMTRMRDMAHSLNPDLIVFTGDQMDRRDSDADLFVQGFSGISAPMGVWGILGNHDHFIDPKRSEWALEAAGIQPLVNSAVTFERSGASLALIGIEDLQARDGREPDFSVLEKYPKSFRICLCHQPQGWHQAAAAGAHLTLSGHTHGGQIALTGRNLNIARFSTRYVAGPYRREEAFLYVSRGVGVGAVPVRVGAPPEIDFLTLRSAATSKSVAA